VPSAASPHPPWPYRILHDLVAPSTASYSPTTWHYHSVCPHCHLPLPSASCTRYPLPLQPRLCTCTLPSPALLPSCDPGVHTSLTCSHYPALFTAPGRRASLRIDGVELRNQASVEKYRRERSVLLALSHRLDKSGWLSCLRPLLDSDVRPLSNMERQGLESSRGSS